MKLGDAMPHSQEFANNSYPEPINPIALTDFLVK